MRTSSNLTNSANSDKDLYLYNYLQSSKSDEAANSAHSLISFVLPCFCHLNASVQFL
jgi:hypothetical protein